jgi:NAD(P)-dependent dehydrogenase (short-subunit alcohol dehydrogenase family)
MSPVAIVTGAASGIGRATADLLASQGVRVAAFDKNAEDPVDVGDPASVVSGVERVRRTLGPVSILVNAAGIPAGGPIDGERYVDLWQETLAVNLTGAMLMVRACLADLTSGGAGTGGQRKSRTWWWPSPPPGRRSSTAP